MKLFVILMRGINVGGKNKIPMAELTLCLKEQGFERVVTYIQSGNAILWSDLDADAVGARIEQVLQRKFTLDSSIVRVLALDHTTFAKIVEQAPKDFGADTTGYRYNVIFPMGTTTGEVMSQTSAREGVDMVWEGDNAVYFRNSVPHATKSHLSKITQQPVYQRITIRNWNTTTKLLTLLETQQT